jgi:hypothetical protein
MPASPAALMTISLPEPPISSTMNHGEAGEQDKEAQYQREAAEDSRTNADLGQHDGRFHWICKKFKNSNE